MFHAVHPVHFSEYVDGASANIAQSADQHLGLLTHLPQENLCSPYDDQFDIYQFICNVYQFGQLITSVEYPSGHDF